MHTRTPLFVALVIAAPASLFAQSPFEGLSEIALRLESAVRTQSEASNRPSMAMIDRETARSMNYDNQLKHVSTYFEKRKLNRAYREAERGPTRTSAQKAATAKRKAPARLSIQQYDAFTGQIKWPVALRHSKYEKGRQYVARLFTAHASAGGGIDTDYYAGIFSSLGKFQDLLKKDYSKTNSQQWLAASKFLESLRYEARFPVGA